MKLFLIETIANVWIVRSLDAMSALQQVDPQGYIRKTFNVDIKELKSTGNTEILFHH